MQSRYYGALQNIGSYAVKREMSQGMTGDWGQKTGDGRSSWLIARRGTRTGDGRRGSAENAEKGIGKCKTQKEGDC